MEQRVIPVRVAEGYDIVVGAGLLAESGRLIRTAVGDCSLAVVTDENVAALYLDPLMRSLARAGYDACAFLFPAGEASKRMHTLAELLEFFAENRLTRRDCVAALGGGVVGDLAGFAAGCYLRGVRYVQLPTTLLAAVDSSVGGKTAVDLAAGKNLAGLFHQPSLVVCDIDCFSTLAPEEFANGAAEAIKTGVLGDETLFSMFETGDAAARAEEAVSLCVRYKAAVVERDEKESGERKLLNLGHTAGHAIELLSGYTIPHGHAVAAGLCIIARAAERLGWASERIAARMEATIVRNGLPTGTTYAPQALAEAALADKKRAGDRITLVVPRKIGACYLKEIPVGELERVFRAGMEANA